MMRLKVETVIFIAFASLAACKKKQEARSTAWGISSPMLSDTLKISSSSRFAGAICSVSWKGKEFINQDDHGRGLQSASSFDGFGECYNPTEAGSRADGSSDTSTSRLVYFSASGNEIRSSTQMAFWASVNEAYPSGCGTDTSIKIAQNTTGLSSHTLTKHITVGFAGIANVIEYLVTYHVPEHHSSATFESLTGYLTDDFSSFWTFDAATQSILTLSPGPGEQSMPVIFSTADSQYAMGIYSPDLPQQSHPKAGYGRFTYPPSQHTVKWNAVFRTGDTPAGDYSYKLYVVVGSLSNVKSGMIAVYHKFYP